MTKEAASKRGFVPAAPFARVIQEWMTKEQAEKVFIADVLPFPPLYRLASETGLPFESLRKLAAGTQEWTAFDSADKIVTTIDPWLWRDDEELAAIYQGYDLTWLDQRKPTVAA